MRDRPTAPAASRGRRPHTADVIYRSGSSRPADFRGFASVTDPRTGKPIPVGVEITELTKGTIPQILDHNRRGGLLFVDSGAVGAHRRGETLDFARVFDLYLSLARLVPHPAQASFVMPDVLGDQAETLRLLAAHARRAAKLRTLGAELIVPLQKGALPLSEAYLRAAAALGTEDFRAGIPSRESLSPEKKKIVVTQGELLEFLAETGASRIHLLGIGKHKTLPARVAELRRKFPWICLSTDSNHLRSILHTKFKAALAERIDEITQDLTTCGGRGAVDWTELYYAVYNEPAVLTREQAERFASEIWPKDSAPEEWRKVVDLALDPEPDPRYGAGRDSSDLETAVHRSKLGNYLENIYDPRAVGEAIYTLALRGVLKLARREARVETIAETEARRIGAAGPARKAQPIQPRLQFGTDEAAA